MMQVALIEGESVAAPFLQTGDQILAINGQPVQRSSNFLPPIDRKDVYN